MSYTDDILKNWRLYFLFSHMFWKDYFCSFPHILFTLDFSYNTFCAILMLLGQEVVPCIWLAFVKNPRNTESQVYSSSPISSIALDDGSNTKSKGSPVPWLPKHEWLSGWMTTMLNEIGKKKACSDKKVEMHFLSISGFLQGFSFMTFLTLQYK